MRSIWFTVVEVMISLANSIFQYVQHSVESSITFSINCIQLLQIFHCACTPFVQLSLNFSVPVVVKKVSHKVFNVRHFVSDMKKTLERMLMMEESRRSAFPKKN